MEQLSSSSKVTVEYFDPYGIYQLLSPGLLPRLPLRNLHWESHSGPLRSIQSLHVDLVPSDEAQPLSPASNSDLSRVKSSESTGSGDDGFRTQTLGQSTVDSQRPSSRAGVVKGSVRGRRHQIPGLRQTPYLKVFLLRCDDNDTYKLHARKQVRDWIKDHTPPAQSTTKINSQENHDAFEWIIVHVVVPNTASATQPPTSTKGSSTILEKLRADFNGTSKSAIDRVAQIRIGINDVPYELLPRVIPAIPGSYAESPQEHEAAWLDLIAKLKLLILSSFDMRVAQYEEDIREKDAQRALPGWNFCTFFVLKEGLARGFESVGLVEDALVGYDELAVGLDAIIREQALTGNGAEHGGSFLPFTDDLRQQFERSRAMLRKDNGVNADDFDGPIDLQSKNSTKNNSEEVIPLTATKKQYRELILANNISIFDFRCYLFARQLSLLLRMGNAWSSQEELLAKLKEQRESSLQGVAARQPPPQPSEETEDLSILAEICRRSLEFVSSISRIMQEDLLACNRSQPQQASADAATDNMVASDPYATNVIDNIVSSFTFSIAQQILAQTSTRSLPIPASTLPPPTGHIAGGSQEPKSSIPEPKTMMHPARSTSLAINGGPPSPGIFPGGRDYMAEQAAKTNSKFLKAGLEELAAHRAELYLLSRSVLERLGVERNWTVGWDATTGAVKSGTSGMEEIDLSQPSEPQEKAQCQVSPSLCGIESKLLRAALDSDDDFYRLYEIFTDKSLRHYTVANHVQSVQTNMSDLAILKYHLQDYAAAASYFYRMTPFYGEAGWENIEMRMLVMYSDCLKRLKRNEEYARVTLKLLAKGAAEEKEKIERRSAMNGTAATLFGYDDRMSVDGYLEDLLKVIPTLQNDITVSLENFFSSVEVDGTANFHEGQDSFDLCLKLRYLLRDELPVEKIKARITPVLGGQGKDIWLESESATVFKNGTLRINVHSSVIIPGTYIVKQVILYSSKMVLSYESEGSSQPPRGNHKFFKSPRIYLYQRPEAFEIQLSPARNINLDQNRSIEIKLSAGWNNILSGELHVRAATAGLRLQTSETKRFEGTLDVMKKSEAGVIRFGTLSSMSIARLELPFTLEQDVQEISLKLEISYTTEEGTFFYASNETLSVMLPLGVNVQDVFKHKALFSKFTITSSASPLRLLSSRLDGSDVYEARNGGELANPVMIFPRQPGSLLYKITRRPTPKSVPSGRKQKSALSLVLHYICLDKEIDNAVHSALSKSLQDSPFYQYSRLIIPTVLSQLRSRASSYEFERTAMIGGLSPSLLSGIEWRSHFLGLGKSEGSEDDIATLIAKWIQAWIEATPKIELPVVEISEETIANSRSISIPVEVPSVNVIHTADLKVPEELVVATEVVVTANQPIPATLNVKWTRAWDTRPISDEGKDMDFVYELSAPTDTWLIGGKRKGHFKVPFNNKEARKQSLSFPVLLIPIKEGYLPYPILDIKAVKTSAVDEKAPKLTSGSEKEKSPALVISCETDYKNIGEVVRVISNARKTTVSLDASGPQGGAWLLETENREASGLYL